MISIKRYIFFFIIVLTGCGKDIPVPDLEIIPEKPTLTANIEVYDSDLLDDSYVLAVENGSKKSYLLDKTGNIVYEWNFDLYSGNDVELLPDGRILGIFKVIEPNFSFGGYGGIIRIYSSDRNIEWEYRYASSEYIAHHDVDMVPNGNVLILAWQRIDLETAKKNGVKFDDIVYPESLIEVNPESNEVVWEWHSFDHIVQDEFPNLSTYGIINENPQLIDVNYGKKNNGDLMHCNGIDYDVHKDVIYLSSNKYSEVWVIDHSTTTAQAKTGTGGNYNKGGDLVYRFGNPEAYRNVYGKRLFYKNHFPNFLEDGVAGAGNVLILNNGTDIKQSSVYELKMPDNFNLKVDEDNEPQIAWSFRDTALFNQNIGGAVRLKNGNTLICEGDYGFWEVTPDGKIAWKYNGAVDVSFWRCYAYDVNSLAVQKLDLIK